MSLAKQGKDIAEIKQTFTRLRPVRTPGILTSESTNGVGRRPLGSNQQVTQNQKAAVPRWS